MSRRRRADRREVIPDAKYNDVMLSKFISIVMMRGEKSKAETIVYGALDILVQRGKGEALTLFHEAIQAVRPEIEVRSRRVGGATYQVPVEVRSDRTRALAFRWIVDAARKRNEQTMVERLGAELTDAASGRGVAVKKRQDVHKMAESNRAFAHYRW